MFTIPELLLGTGTHQEQHAGEGKTSQQFEPEIPASTQPPVDTSEPLKSSRKRIPEEDALGHIRRAVQAIINLNDQEGQAFDDKWYISFPVVQTLLRENGLSANQKNVAAVFEEMKQELEHHHDKHQIGSRHNRRHPKIEKINKLISLS
jgi:hypothetical protein